MTGNLDDAAMIPAEAESILADMAALGWPDEEIAKARADLLGQVKEPILAIHGENAVAAKAFFAMGTQWQAIGLSTMQRANIVRTGLKYEALRETAALAGLEVTPDDFARIRIMEAEALEAWAEARSIGR